MRVFISYSRKDAAFVERLRRGLEADGHDVWVDTEDIRGSDQWRASVVKGLRAADVVLLLVSPASAASENVEREVTLAAEVDRRILPIVVAPAELSGSIAFELAGVHRLSFVGRPFDDGLVDLRHELQAIHAAAGGTTPAAPVPRPVRRNNRPLIIAAVAGVAVIALAFGIVAVVASGGDDGDGQQAAGAQTTVAAAATSAAIAPPAADLVDQVDVNGAIWFGGFSVTIETATYDESIAEVALTATFVNDQALDDDPKVILGASTALLWGDGRRSGGFCVCAALPPGEMERDVIRFDVDESFTWEGSALVFGSAGQHQAFVPLDGQEASSPTPESHDIAGTTDDGAGTSFAIEAIHLVPAACFGLADGLGFEPGPADHASLVVWGTARATKNGTALGVAQVVLPDGTTLASSSLNGTIYTLQAGVPQRDVGICFDIPIPVDGEYRLTVKAGGVTTDPPPFTFTL